ncbi:ATP-binding protein [Kitasatospora sp. NPDC101176]|uniref:ATP-binding protein n=1 Tax=Kitasatospora sp. NPDC101176 TaxID=3364099 RepID=UPI0038300E35
MTTTVEMPQASPLAVRADRTCRAAVAEPPAQPCTWDLPHESGSAGAARRMTRETLEDWGLEGDCVDRALVVVSELVTNAVEHALPPITLRLDPPAEQETIRLAVGDGGAAVRKGPWIASCSPDEHGRGCDIIDALTVTHGSRVDADRSTHWADLPLAG